MLQDLIKLGNDFPGGAGEDHQKEVIRKAVYALMKLLVERDYPVAR